MKAIPLLVSISAMLSAQAVIETHSLAQWNDPAHKECWQHAVEYVDDAVKGKTVIIHYGAKSRPGGNDLHLSGWAPKFDDWNILRFDYKVSHPKDWFGIKVSDKPLADGWQATWQLTVPENADKEWQTASVELHKPMWRWGDRPTDARFVTFRVSHESDEPMTVQIANLTLIRSKVSGRLTNETQPVTWKEGTREGSIGLTIINHNDHPVTLTMTNRASKGIVLDPVERQLEVPANGNVLTTVNLKAEDGMAGLSKITANMSVKASDGAEIGAWTVGALVPMDALESPCLVFTKAMIPEIQRRIRETEGGRDWWTGIKKAADDWLEKTPEFPPRGAQWWHWYSCKKCGVKLSTETKTRHVCPVCKAVYTGWPYDDVVLDRDHHHLAYSTRDLGIVYQLTKDVRYAKKAREILMGYAERYLSYPLHDINGKPSAGGGHVTPQTLDESTWSIPLVQGFDCIKEQLSAEDITFIAEKMLLPAAYHIMRHQWGIHNICCWHNSSYGLIGMTLGNTELVWNSIFGPKGFLAQVEKGVTEDGPWYERAWGYHFYTVMAMMPMAYALRNTKIAELPPRFKLMFDAPLKFLTPTYQLPAFHDSGRVNFSFAGNADRYEPVYAWWQDPAHGEIVKQGKHRSSEAVLYGVSDIVTNGSTYASADYHDTGVAVLRAQSAQLPKTLIPSNYIALDYGEHGGGHGHPDKLNFVLYGHNQLIAEDPGCIAYGNPAHAGWYRQTLSHNTLVIDGKSQIPTAGSCLAFASMPEASICVADAGGICPGVKARRAMALIGDCVFDVLWADSKVEHQYEYAFHARGTLTTAQAGTETEAPKGDGYVWATDWKLLSAAPAQDFVWTQDAVKLALTLKQLPEGETRTAIGMGNPPTVKPPFVLSRINGKSALFGGAFQLGTADTELKPADMTVTRNGSSIELKAAFADGRTYVFAVDTEAADGKAKLSCVREGKLENILIAR